MATKLEANVWSTGQLNTCLLFSLSQRITRSSCQGFLSSSKPPQAPCGRWVRKSNEYADF